MRLIDADVLRTSIEKDREASNMPKMWYDGIAYAINHIIHAPTADVVEVKHGKWEVCNILDYAQRPSGRKVGMCPHCGYLTDEFRTIVESSKKLTNFCPNCGVKMDGKEVEDE